MRIRPGFTAVWLLLSALSSGCSIGPGVIRYNFVRYNEAVAETENEQFLLNLVRLRYRDPPKTLGLSQVTSQFSYDKVGAGQMVLPSFFASTVAKTMTPTAFSTSTLGPFQARTTDVPTITMIPQSGTDFTRGLVAPVPIERIVLLASTGWDLDRLLRLLVHRINDVDNASRVAGKAADYAPEFEEFKCIAGILGDLQGRGLLRLAIDPEPAAYADLSEPLDPKEGPKLAEIKPTELINAADKHYRFCKIGDKIILRSTIDVHDLIVKPDALTDFGWQSVSSALKLGTGKVIHSEKEGPGRPMFAFRLLPADKAQLREHFDENKDIFVGTRSLLGSMLFLSKGIEVPLQHYKDGLVAPPPARADGQPFDWPDVTDGLFRVRTSKCRPKHSFASVKYRDFWFYIAEDDLTSKSTFALLLEMFDVQIAPGAATAPILTLNASGPTGR